MVHWCLPQTTYDCDRQSDLRKDEFKVVSVGGRVEDQNVGLSGAFRLGGMYLNTALWYNGACLSY